MFGELAAAIRQRLSLRTAVTWAVTLAVIYYFSEDLALVAGIATAFLFTAAFDLLADLPGVDERWPRAGFAVVVGAASTAWLWYTLFEGSGEAWLPLLAVLASLWLLLDVRADFVQDRRPDSEAAEELSSADAMLVMQHASLVAEELEGGPMTVAELATACDLTVSRVEDVVDFAGRDGSIYPVDPDAEQPRYALDEQKMGLSGLGRQAAGGVSGLVSRFMRPFTEQF